jgi:uncharacterized protein YndB with AHSA1/START domain
VSDDICGINPAANRGLISRTHVPAPRERVWRALSEEQEVNQWLASARVDLAAGIFELWGLWVPDAPEQPVTRLTLYRPEEELQFAWRMYGVETIVTLSLADANGGTNVEAKHQGIIHSDLWVVVLENLRAHCLGLDPRPYDFSRPMPSDLKVSMEIDASSDAVFQGLLDPQTLDKFWANGASYDEQARTLDYGWGTPPLRILDLQPGKRLQVAWWEDEKHPETTVTWVLEGSEGGTRITLTHTGFAAGVEHDGLDIGWFGFLLALRSILEQGEQWSKIEPQSFKVEEPVAG